MIPIALHRSLSGNIAWSDVRLRKRGHTSEGRLDKSADVRHAHVVGWVEFSRCCKKLPAGAFPETPGKSNHQTPSLIWALL